MSSKVQPICNPNVGNFYRSPIFILAVGILAVSSASLFIRYAQREMPSIVIAAYRLGLASLIMTPWVWRKHNRQIVAIGRENWIRIIVAGLLLAFHFASWITSLEFTSVSSSVVLVTTTPIWVALFSPLILKERSNRMTLIGLVVAIIGGVIVSMSNECVVSMEGMNCALHKSQSYPSGMLGNGLALCGAICAAFYLIIGRILRKSIDLSVYVYCIFFSAAVFLVFFVIISGISFYPYSISTLLLCLALAVFPQIVGHTSLNWALGYLPVGLVAIVLLGEPVGSSILAALFLKEIPASLELAGGIIILLGIFLASRK
ncbi:MAG: DMT family transporter [Leptolinea sp.]|nr:DMT family transporter [Leptolinea sp.]